MLIRMTKIQMKLAAVAGVLAVFAGSAIASPEDTRSKGAIVVAGAAANDKVVLAQAHAVAEATDSDLKVVKTDAEQLGVVHMLAARGYDEVVTVGVDRRTAIAPVAGKYPHVRFVAAEANGLSAAISGAV
jgi:basic membrane lipoprotein Med (substrate-binding protein (PBP1-ABC) superfamily)